MKNEPGKRPPQGAGEGSIQNRSVRLNTKNEPVVGRNNYHRAGPCKGAMSPLQLRKMKELLNYLDERNIHIKNHDDEINNFMKPTEECIYH